MKRTTFVVGAGATALVVPRPALASATTVVLVSSNVPELDDDATNFLCEALRSRGVRVVDPSSVQTTYHERDVLIAMAFGPLFAAEAERVAWIDRRYGASRAMFVHINVTESSLPYGDFTVTTIRAACTFRCMNVATAEIVKAGSYRAERKGEDPDSLRPLVVNDAALELARSAAPGLS